MLLCQRFETEVLNKKVCWGEETDTCRQPLIYFRSATRIIRDVNIEPGEWSEPDMGRGNVPSPTGSSSFRWMEGAMFIRTIFLSVIVAGSLFADCTYQTVIDPATGKPVTVWVCSQPGQPDCHWDTVIDPETGAPVTVWVCTQ